VSKWTTVAVCQLKKNTIRRKTHQASCSAVITCVFD
jgi:hypothetical protein